jgi:aminopeptidase N
MTLQALRNHIGGETFFRMLRRWAVTRANRTGTTEQFIRLAERLSGVQLDGLFDRWLYERERPSPCLTDATRSLGTGAMRMFERAEATRRSV